MQFYFLCLSTWTVLTKLASNIIKRKHVSYVSMLHTGSCIYLLSTNNNQLATINTVAYFTHDMMNIVHTNYYTIQNRCIFSFHHIISIVTLVSVQDGNELYPMMLNTLYDIEMSNLALYAYYLISKIANLQTLAICNGLEALMYGYYRVGIIKHCYNELLYNTSEHYTHSILFLSMYSFGVFFTGALICTTFNRVSNLFNHNL
jgi:hypothetical protein